MKVIFLDIDGVLNFEGSQAKAPNGCVGISEAPMKKLSKFIKETGAKIVLISTWQKDWAFDEESLDGNQKLICQYLNKKFERHGIRIMDKVGGQAQERMERINEWLSKRPNVDKWVVLDDEVFPGYIDIKPKFVRTNYLFGLQDEDIEYMRKVLEC